MIWIIEPYFGSLNHIVTFRGLSHGGGACPSAWTWRSSRQGESICFGSRFGILLFAFAFVNAEASQDDETFLHLVTHQVEAVGICAGDAKTFTGAERFWGRSSFDLINFVSSILNSFNDHSTFLRIKTFL